MSLCLDSSLLGSCLTSMPHTRTTLSFITRLASDKKDLFLFLQFLILNILEFLEISALQVRSKVIDTFFLLFMCIASGIADQSFVVLAPFCTSSWRPPVSSEPLAGYKLVHGAPLGNCRPSQARLRIEHNIMFQSNQGAGDGKLTIIQCRNNVYI